MAEVPNSYKDPYWTNLSTIMEKKHGLPSGLLVNIVQKGERTDNNKSSPVGAKTVYQIMPNTRKLFLKKYGVDAYASPKAAAEVAALHLKESLQRNKGDIPTAVREYHGGPNRSGWGKVNDAYVGRVLGGGQQQNERPSRLARARQRVTERQEASQQSLDNIYRAYKSGKMTAQEKADYERDVGNGSIMLSRGQTLNKSKNSAEQKGVLLSQGVADAYYNNTMTPEDRADLERDRKAGLVRLPTPTKMQSDLPNFDAQGVILQEPTELTEVIEPELPPTVSERLKGAGETALTLGTGATTGAVGQFAGTAKGIANALLEGEFGTAQGAKNIEQSAMQGAEALTYQPRTATGQQYTQSIGELLAPTVALTPALSELAMVGQATRGVAPIAVGEGQRAVQAVGNVANRTIVQPIKNAAGATTEAIKSGVTKVGNVVGLGEPEIPKSPQGSTVGAAAVDQATLRQALAQDLPVKPEMTLGQLTRDENQLSFEQNIARTEEGAPIRERYADQNAAINQNLDVFIDQTGGELSTLRDVGVSVDAALQKQMMADKNRVRAAYAKAEKSEEANTPVDLNVKLSEVDGALVRAADDAVDAMSITDYLNSQPELPTAPIVGVAKTTGEKLGIFSRDADGNLVSNNPSIKQLEKWRQEINANTNIEAPNVRQATILKNYIDAHIEPSAGSLYKSARLERKRFGDKWENNAIIKSLTSLKKGTEDRSVAFENVQKKIVQDGSLDDLRKVKRTLLTSGEEGKQAWKEVQAATLREIKDLANKSVATNARGETVISPAALNKAITNLDKTGKLQYLFGQDGANKLNALNDVAKALMTVPPETMVNRSGSGLMIAAAVDMIMSGASGFPAPVATAMRTAINHIKDRKIRKRVEKALNLNQQNSGRF